MFAQLVLLLPGEYPSSRRGLPTPTFCDDVGRGGDDGDDYDDD